MIAPQSTNRRIAVLIAAVVFAGCADGATSPSATSMAETSSLQRAGEKGTVDPSFNLNVKLRGAGEAEGSIKFRQPNDGVVTIFLGTKIEGLAPNHDYFLQRAALSLGEGCVDDGWLTLGLGTVATPIHTNKGGEGKGEFFRTLPASLAGASFDIHFQIIDGVTGAVVLSSPCYQYMVNGN